MRNNLVKIEMWHLLGDIYLIVTQKETAKSDNYCVFTILTNIILKFAKKIKLSFGVWKTLYGREH